MQTQLRLENKQGYFLLQTGIHTIRPDAYYNLNIYDVDPCTLDVLCLASEPPEHFIDFMLCT